MLFKKINAVIGLLTVFMLLDHSIAGAVQMLMKDLSHATPVPAYILLGLTAVHIIISIFMITIGGDGNTGRYASLYKGTILQRVTGFLTIAVLPVHIISAQNMADDHNMLVAFVVSQIVFLILAMIHTAISVPNAGVTLGFVKSIKRHKLVRLISTIVCAIVGVLGIVASIVFLL